MRDHLAFNLQHLDRQMAFFPRVDTKGAALFTVDVGLLSILALNFPYSKPCSMLGFAALFSAALAALSLWRLYHVFFPHLKASAMPSLIFFGDIASRAEDTFVKELAATTDDALAKDAAHQVWRNAEILKLKFGHVQQATILTAMSLVPWLAFLVITAVEGGKIALGS